MTYVFEPPAQPAVPVVGTDAMLPVRRIFCVGKNYADHVAEMGGDPGEADPVFFTKPADAVHPGGPWRYPRATGDAHYEGELVVALGAGGEDLGEAEAARLVYGVAAGCDVTRRDAQAAAKAKGAPWDAAKALDDGAVMGPITPGPVPAAGTIRTLVNGTVRQDARLGAMILGVPAILARLSRLFALRAGDLVFTGTPEGVGPLVPGDAVRIEATGCAPCTFTVVPR